MRDVIANALRSPHARIINDGYYQNEEGIWGWYVTVWDAGHYHMISVSHVSNTPTKHEVAAALVSPTRYIKEEGRYRNSRGTLGYWATVKSGDHWYMVSVSDMLQPFHNQWWLERIS